MKQPHHTVLFNIAGLTLIHLSVSDLKKVYNYIEETMNGDGLYGKNPEKEILLEAYYDQEMSDHLGLNWVDHISVILEELGLIDKYVVA